MKINLHKIPEKDAIKIREQLNKIEKETGNKINKAQVISYHPEGPDPELGIYKVASATLLINCKNNDYLTEIVLSKPPMAVLYDEEGIPLEKIQENILNWGCTI